MDLIKSSLTSIKGSIKRHDRQGNQEMVCQATRLGNGLWLTVADRGVYGGTVYGEIQGTAVLVDLWLHPADGRPPMPIQWASRSELKPIAVINVPQDIDGLDPAARTPVIKMGDVFRKDFEKFFRIDAGGNVEEGQIYDRPWSQMYDVDDDKKTAIVARGNMGYRMAKTDCGGPLVGENGSLMGVIVGKDWGGDSHAGFFMPVAMLEPSLDLVAMMVQRRNSRESEWRLNIETVSHRSNDVYFD